VRIGTLLQGKGSSVATISPDATVTEAVEELARLRIGALVVSSDGEHIAGIVSERDIVRHLNNQAARLLDEPVSSIMSVTVVTCSPDDDTERLMAIMTDNRVRHVPVVLDGVLCGLVSIGDVVKSRMDELEKDRKELTDYITAR